MVTVWYDTVERADPHTTEGNNLFLFNVIMCIPFWGLKGFGEMCVGLDRSIIVKHERPSLVLGIDAVDG